MGFGRFYGHFAAAYGTFWFVLMLVAVLTQSNINAGLFGLIGFPLIAVVYAFLRMSGSERPVDELTELRARVARLEDEQARGPDDGEPPQRTPDALP